MYELFSIGAVKNGVRFLADVTQRACDRPDLRHRGELLVPQSCSDEDRIPNSIEFTIEHGKRRDGFLRPAALRTVSMLYCSGRCGGGLTGA